jgi:hypothetical protein
LLCVWSIHGYTWGSDWSKIFASKLPGRAMETPIDTAHPRCWVRNSWQGYANAFCRQRHRNLSMFTKSSFFCYSRR